MDTVKTQALVIGAGPGGYPCAIRLGQLKVPTIVVEKYKPGGVCLNVGCIPSKALINAAKLFDKMRHGADMGLLVDNARVDMGRLVDWKDDVVGKLTGGVKQLLKANGAEYRQGEVRLVSKNEVEVRDPKGASYHIQARSIVIATGSRPIEIPGFKVDEKRILSSTGALALREVPGRLVVIGGGYIGLELGMMYAKLGSKVAVIEMTPTLLPGTDPELVQVVARKMKKLGMETHLEARAKSDDGKAVTIESKDGASLKLDADSVLVTVGRRPNSDGLGLAEVGVAIDAKGFVKVDQRMRTNVEGIYAIGDVAGQPMLAHKATKEGEVAAEVIAGRASAMDVRAIPAVIFTDPEIATCGLSDAEARASGREVAIGKFPMVALGRALALAEPDGFVKIVLDKASKEVLGVHVVGSSASDVISEAALALEMGAMAEDIGLTIHPHPTIPEAIMEASKAALGEAIHIVNR
ncbi:MAG TPA: dihydrolipoyl dehydrogenase [Polyangia bacterium]|nr:dihydrolipoyl dehydrogenase [Polyangia bacterium]